MVLFQFLGANSPFERKKNWAVAIILATRLLFFFPKRKQRPREALTTILVSPTSRSFSVLSALPTCFLKLFSSLVSWLYQASCSAPSRSPPLIRPAAMEVTLAPASSKSKTTVAAPLLHFGIACCTLFTQHSLTYTVISSSLALFFIFNNVWGLFCYIILCLAIGLRKEQSYLL